MALPTVQDAKDYLRLKTSAEDSVITQLLLRAQATVERVVGIPLIKAADTLLDDTTTSARAYSAPTRLLCERYPIEVASVVVKDVQGATVDPATYRIDPRSGLITGNAGVSFGNGPYTITGNVGLSAHPDYASRLEALAGAVIIDLVADLYQRRNPAAASETAGGGVGVQYHADAIPPRTRGLLSLLRQQSGLA